MSKERAERLAIVGERFGQTWAQLSSEALDSRTKAWKVSPKHHLFWHILDAVEKTRINPKSYWVYADEDLVGQLITIAESTHPHTLAQVSLAKWLAAALASREG